MVDNKASKANTAYRAGAYDKALRLYHELGDEFGHEFFYANVAVCLDRLEGGSGAVRTACSDLVSNGKFNFLQELHAENIVVSLTSYPARIKAVVEAIKSILAQSVKPGKVVLWLAEGQFPRKETDLPDQLLCLKDEGLCIDWCEDIRSYKKLVPSLDKYPNRILVTADDDLLYTKTWLLELIVAHIQTRDAVVCHRAHLVSLDEEGSFASYKEWPKEVKGQGASFEYLCTSGAGVLYPPGSLHRLVMDREAFTSACPTGDDLWFWAMAVLNDTKIQIVKDSSFSLDFVPSTQDEALWIENVRGGGNDKMLRELDARYPDIRKRVHEGKDLRLASEPKISIVIPIYNTGSHLSDCLNSIIGQDFDEFEVLCVDDGTTDEHTLDIMKRYCERDLRVRVIRQENSGPATARNSGLRHAKGMYVAFIDSDDYVSAHYLGALYQAAQRHNVDMAIVGRILEVREGDSIAVEKRSGFESFGKVEPKQLAAEAILATGVSCNKLYKKDFLLRHGIKYLDGMMCQAEDNYFSIMAAVLGHRSISIARDAVYYYRQHVGGITKNITRESFEKSVLVYEEVKSRLKDAGVPDMRFWLNVVNKRALKDLMFCAKALPVGGGVKKRLIKSFGSSIDICCIADENYIVPTMVFLESIKQTKARITIPSVTVLVPQGAGSRMAVLEELSSEDFFVRVLEVDVTQFENLHRRKKKDDFMMASPSAMFKFIIPSVFAHLDRILYIDTDLMVRKDLLDLFMTAFGGHYLCAVPDLWTPVAGREDIKKFGVYFNSGVMLMDLACMRAENLPKKLIETKRNTTNFNLMDQDVFNEVCDGRVKVLDIRFNFLPVCYKRHKHRFNLASVNELYGSKYSRIDEIAVDPVVAHWAGSDKPWVTSETLFANEWLDTFMVLKAKGMLNREDLVQWASRQAVLCGKEVLSQDDVVVLE